MAAGAEDGPTIDSHAQSLYSLQGLPRRYACPECVTLHISRAATPSPEVDPEDPETGA
jgi:hypothetical protein